SYDINQLTSKESKWSLLNTFRTNIESEMGENRPKSYKMRQKKLTRCNQDAVYKQPIKSKLLKFAIHFMGN
ncbi:hypothetical protein, partial [Bartonella vinsonii]|uniref:hypothetical protein n=1 Tax=Bartonella vinsonii TaxID=33047 RepID=UPI001ABBC66C